MSGGIRLAGGSCPSASIRAGILMGAGSGRLRSTGILMGAGSGRLRSTGILMAGGIFCGLYPCRRGTLGICGTGVSGHAGFGF